MLGAEESGGLSILGHIPDKDGILACLLVAEMAAVTGKSLTELREEFTAEYGEVANEKMDLHYGLQDQEQIMHLLNEYNPKSIAGVKVEQNQNTGGRKFVMEDGSWVLIRPANTEPVLRIYVEALDRVRLGDIQREIQNALGL